MKQKSAFALVALMVGVGVILPLQQAHAFIFPSLGDIWSLALEGLDFVQNILLGVVTRIFVALLVSSAALFSSARFLDWAVGIPIDLQNGLVTAGFKFTSGLVNLVIVVLFVLVAFSAILKFDAFGAKKALPKLILVALLVNFSMLIVGFFVDIAQVFFNSIQTVLKEDITSSAIGTMKDGIKKTIDWFVQLYGLFFASILFPPALPATVSLLGLKIVSGLNGGQLLQALFLVAINTILAGMFGLYALLFVARVVVIWLLAIVAPLALAAWAFPVKNNYFGDWFKQLISWSFLGIVAFFLMGLGLKLFSLILGIHPPCAPGIEPEACKQLGVTPIDIGGSEIQFFHGFFAYLFLAVYLFVAFQVSKKFAPAAATALIEQGKALVAPQLKAIGSRLGSAAWKRFLQKPVEDAGKGARGYGERLTRWGEQKKGLVRAMARTSGWGAKRMGRRIEAGAGTLSRGVASQNQQEATAAENEQYIYAADARDKINDELQKGAGANWNRIIGLTHSMIKHGDADDLQTYIRNGSLDGKAIGKAILFGQERLGPAGYRTLIKGLGGMIYTEPEKLGWEVQQASEITRKQIRGGYTVKDGVVVDSYGSKAIKGGSRWQRQENFLEDTVKREIVEKLRPEEITTMSILGDYIKKADDPYWSAGHDALVTRIIRETGGNLLGSIARRGETRAARQHTGDLINTELNTHFGKDMSQEQTIEQFADAHPELIGSFASTMKFADSPLAASSGIVIEYQRAGVRNVQEEIKNALFKRAAPLRELNAIQTEIDTARRQRDLLSTRDPAFITKGGKLSEAITRLTEELNQTTQEFEVLRDVARVRFASQGPANPLPLNEVVREVQREYEQTYRTPIYQQIRSEEPLIQWNASRNFGGNYQQARTSRIREVYDRLRLQDLTPPLTPSPSAKEEKLFESIAQSEAPLPPVKDGQRERKLAGSLKESLQWAQDIEANIMKSSETGMRTKWQGELDKAKQRMAEIRRELNLT